LIGGIALAWGELPLELIERHGLEHRVHERGGEREVRFLYRQRPRWLPAWVEGQVRLVPWGNRRGESRRLPCTGWTWLATVEAGTWADWGAVPVDVPATMACDNGVWYHIDQGIRGLLVGDERGLERVFLICEPASHYYEVMTRSRWMPVLIGQRI
jgi:hypothetical protein